jgi:hypothetical protein
MELVGRLLQTEIHSFQVTDKEYRGTESDLLLLLKEAQMRLLVPQMETHGPH